MNTATGRIRHELGEVTDQLAALLLVDPVTRAPLKDANGRDRVPKWTSEQRRQYDELVARQAGLNAQLDAIEGHLSRLGEQSRARQAGGGILALPPEAQRLAEQVTLGDYAEAAIAGRPPVGAARELSAELKLPETGRGGGIAVPLELLDPARAGGRSAEFVNTKTDATSTVMAEAWLERVFQKTDISRLGITAVPVSDGTMAYPMVSQGGTASQKGREESASAQTWKISAAQLKPARLAIRYDFTSEDARRLPDLGRVLEDDARMQTAAQMSRIVISGDTASSEDQGDIVGLLSHSGVAEKSLKQADKTTPARVLAVFSSLADGRFSYALDDQRILLSSGCNNLWDGAILGAPNSMTTTLSEWLRRQGLEWSVAGFESDTADGDYGGVVALPQGLPGAARLNLWRAAEITRDPFSQLDKGVIRIVFAAYWSFSVIRAANFARLVFKA